MSILIKVFEFKIYLTKKSPHETSCRRLYKCWRRRTGSQQYFLPLAEIGTNLNVYFSIDVDYNWFIKYLVLATIRHHRNFKQTKNCQNHLINLNQKFARMSLCNSINFVTVLWVCEGKLNIMSMFSSHVNTNDQLSRLRPVSGVVQMHSAQLKMFIRDFGFQSALGHGQ